MTQNDISDLQQQLKESPAEEIVKKIHERYGQKLALASSLGAEDQVLTHMLCQQTASPRIIVLDTGRLNQETYDVMATTSKKYGFQYEIYFPEAKAVEEMVREKGVNLFYESVENRKSCCHIRKVEPLNRALATCAAWITGMRRDQSPTRSEINSIEWDDAHNCVKVNPLIDWTEEQVWDTIKKHNIPYNALHDQGYPSIGCAPCTRAIKEGEDSRAGRWWWEQPDQKECGIHVVNGKRVPIKKRDSHESQSNKEDTAHHE